MKIVFSLCCISWHEYVSRYMLTFSTDDGHYRIFAAGLVALSASCYLLSLSPSLFLILIINAADLDYYSNYFSAAFWSLVRELISLHHRPSVKLEASPSSSFSQSTNVTKLLCINPHPSFLIAVTYFTSDYYYDPTHKLRSTLSLSVELLLTHSAICSPQRRAEQSKAKRSSDQSNSP